MSMAEQLDPFAAPVSAPAAPPVGAVPATAAADAPPAGAVPAGPVTPAPAPPPPPPAPVAAPVLPDEAYVHNVGAIVKTAAGYAVVVDRGPTTRSYLTAQGRQDFVVPGYVVAHFSGANETPHTAEELGIG